MKLAFCLFNYFPHGGLQRDFMRVAELSAARGHEIHVHTMRWEGTKPSSFIIHEEKPHAFTLGNHARASWFARQLQSKIKGKYDLVIGFNKMPGLDLYYAADGCFAEKLESKKPRWLHRLLTRNRTYLALETAIFNHLSKTHVLYIAKKNQETYEKHYSTEKTKQFLLPPGIDTHFQRLSPKKTVYADLRQQLKIQQNTLSLLMVASSFKTKGLDRALRAIASLKQALQKKLQLNVIGNDHPSLYIRLAQQLNVSATINYLGAQQNIAEWMQASDLMIHPAYHESAGLVILEAIAAGLPILTTATCGYAHFVVDGNAGIVLDDPFSQADFNMTLHNMLSQPAELAQLSDNAHQFAKQVDFYSMPEIALNIIETLGGVHA